MTEPVVPPRREVPPASTIGSGRFAQGALFGFIGVEAITLVSSLAMILRWDDRQAQLNSGEPFFADGWELGLGLAYFGMVTLVGIAWLIWQYQAHVNLTRLTTTPRFRPWAAFLFLVPVVSLFLPYQAVAELARAGSDRPVLRRRWWTLFLATNLMVGGASALALLGSMRWSTIVRGLAAAVGIAAAASAIAVVSLVNSGLATRRAAVGWPAGPPALARRSGPVLAGSAAVLTVLGGGLFGVLLPEIVRNLPATPETNLSFTVGSCFTEGDGEYVDVSCEDPHEAEIYQVIDHPDYSAYPGAKLIEDWAEAICWSRFAAYTGMAYQDSALDFGYFYPSAQGWLGGDREVVCYLFNPNGQDLTGPAAQPPA